MRRRCPSLPKKKCVNSRETELGLQVAHDLRMTPKNCTMRHIGAELIERIVLTMPGDGAEAVLNYLSFRIRNLALLLQISLLYKPFCARSL